MTWLEAFYEDRMTAIKPDDYFTQVGHTISGAPMTEAQYASILKRRELISKWWASEEFNHISARFGYQCKIVNMPSNLDDMQYRFNAVLYKSP